MQARLEEILRSKEQELKLYQRFIDLKTFCEEQLFPYTNLPLREHVDTLKRIVERIVPEARDRTEELFSGEIFTLLGTVYMHDVELVRNARWSTGVPAIGTTDGPRPAFLLNYEIAKSLDIPEMAMEIINYLTFSGLVKRMPMEWAITEDSRRAIIRNTRLIDRIFNFSHLLVDIFFTDIQHGVLKRFRTPVFALRPQSAKVDIDSREGVITIHYEARLPYDLHVLAQARPFVETGFTSFKNGVNGKLGFRYRDIVWEVSENLEGKRKFFDLPRFTAYDESEEPPLGRYEEASAILDRIFTHGHALVVGSLATGKTTVLKAFLIPQLRATNENVFYVELWDHPIDEVRSAIGLAKGRAFGASLDIVLLCRELLRTGPCFFILDGCERLAAGLDEVEREKLKRFLEFCMAEGNAYVVAVGDMDSFFRWYDLFSSMSLASVYEVRAPERQRFVGMEGGRETLEAGTGVVMPVELELRKANKEIEDLIGHILTEGEDRREIRSLVASLLGPEDGRLRRYTVENIRSNTAISRDRIAQHLKTLQTYDIVRQTESMGATYYALSSLYLIEPLYRVLDLKEFDGRRELQKTLQAAISGGVFTEAEALSLVMGWKHDMMFTPEQSGIVLAGLIHHSLDWKPFFEKVDGDGRGIDIHPLLRLLESGDEVQRFGAIAALGEIGDKAMINPLLLHLKREPLPENRRLIVHAVGSTRGKGAILALMKTLREMDDVALSLHALDAFGLSLATDAPEILAELTQGEESTAVRRKLDAILLKIKEK